MISIDNYLWDFVKYNYFTLTLVIGFLKILATRTESNIDDSILTLLGDVISKLKSGTKKNADIN